MQKLVSFSSKIGCSVIAHRLSLECLSFPMLHDSPSELKKAEMVKKATGKWRDHGSVAMGVGTSKLTRREEPTG